MEKKIIIITGGANGLGYELVEEAIKNNLFVCNIDRDSQKMPLLAEKFKENYMGFIGDISDEEFVKETVEQISTIGEISVLINNAGEPSFKMPKDYSKIDIDKCFKGLEGMILFSTEVKEEKNLKIVNIMSSAALRGNKQEAVYCATKWGEKGYTESLKAAYKGTSVKVI